MPNTKSYYRKNRIRINEDARMRWHYGNKWWLRLAWIKAGGKPEDWPIKRNQKMA